jgi:predicted dehydrogenase
MKTGTNRRDFLRETSLLGAGLAGFGMMSTLRAAEDEPAQAARADTASSGAAQPFVVGIIGTGGRGQQVAAGFAASPGVSVKYLCDVDDAMLAKGQSAVAKRLAATRPATKKPRERDSESTTGAPPSPPASLTPPAAPPPAQPSSPSHVGPTGVKDFRRVLEDDAVHAVTIATPDHWHAPAAILALKAGKHVYVEKPCSHNPREGELLLQAARKYNRVVQHGTQRRSWAGVIKAIQAVRGGQIGNVRIARAWYAADRASIGRGKGVPVPPNLDYAMWQGPAPERPYRDNLLHYHWHWFWHWGTGELGNNGVHFLDLCRWGLGVDYPKRVTSAGGRYFFSDDQETPDTQTATFEFGDKMIVWEHRSCQPRGIDGERSGVSFHGDKGTILITGNGFKLFDPKDKLVDSTEEKADIDAAHIADFVDAARRGRRPNADIEDGHKSTLLCHLGNIALRAGRTLNVDPKNGRITGDGDAETRFWAREYRPEWEPKV